MSSVNEAIFMEYIQLVSKKYGIPEEDLKNISNEKTQEVPEIKDFSKLTVAELKKICTSLGLRKQSTKPKLLQILEDHYRQQPTIPSNPPTTITESDNIIIIEDKKKTILAEEEEDIDESDTSFDDTFILDDDDDCGDPDMMD